jgi:hypothetical protein
MKYLKLFESIFGAAEPKRITSVQFVTRKKQLGNDFFTKSEHRELIDIMERNGYEYVTNDIWQDLVWNQTEGKYNIGVTYLYFNFFVGDEGNPQPYEVALRKLQDDYFLIAIYQEEWDGDDDEYYSGYDEYYECDGFECAFELLKKEAKLK